MDFYELQEMNESNVEYLISMLEIEKDKYVQEIIANRIGQFKSEYTANLVVKMLETDDARIRNTAIEILQDMGEMCINSISKMIYHKDKNVRKFILDIIKEIKNERSSLLAIDALNDDDDNIIQTAIEILNYHKYIPAIPKLLDILKTTNNVWILVALINTFAELGEKSVTEHIEEKLNEISLTTLEKNIVINSYIKALGNIGSIVHLEKVMTIYKDIFQIDDYNLEYCINRIIARNEVHTLSLEVIDLIKGYYEKKIKFNNLKLNLENIRIAVKLGFIFFMDDLDLLKGLIINSYSEEYSEDLFEIVANQKDISRCIITELMKDNNSEVKVFALRFIRRRRILGYNETIKDFCLDETASNLCAEALRIIAEIEEYYDKNILNQFVNCNNYELSKIAIQGIKFETTSDSRLLMKMLRSSNSDVRKVIVKKFIENREFIDINDIVEIVSETKDATIVDALEILFNLDGKIAEEIIGEILDNEDKEIRKKIVKIIKLIKNDDIFYKYMYIMAQDCDEEVRRAVIKEISKENEYKAFVFLKGLLESENEMQNKYEIICSLYKYKFEDCYRLIVRNLYSDNLLLKLAAITSLGSYGDKRAIEYLKDLIDDIDPDVKECAQEALYRLEVVK